MIPVKAGTITLLTWYMAQAGRICTEPAGYTGANKSWGGRKEDRKAADAAL